MDKAFKFGLLLGRFQTFHNGHREMVRTALHTCDKVLLFIGSSQESRTEKNPFTYEERREFITSVFKKEINAGTLIILPLEDRGLGNNSSWGQYVLDSIPAEYGKPDVAISAKEERRTTWYPDIAELLIPKYGDISATQVRKLMTEGNRTEWQKLVPSQNHRLFNKMREILIKSECNTNTQSI